jgi:hypothetical protein
VSGRTEQGSHFWLMVIEAPSAMGVRINSYQGTRTPGRGMTRLDLFNSVRAEVEERDPLSRGGVVTAFDVQPNKL